MSEKSRFTVAVVVFDSVELVDMNGPADVFFHANDFVPGSYEIVTVGPSRDAVLSEGQIVGLVPTYSADDPLDPDIVVVPGRIPPGTTAGPRMTEWVAEMSGRGKTILSVCVGIFTLAEAGLLNGRRATTHYLAIDEVEERFPAIEMVKNVRYVEDGQFITTGGVTSGIDGALALVAKLSGADLAQKIADLMVYDMSAPVPPRTILPLAGAPA
jgi:transcriptional regulator GlxA family with amidase domain